MFQHQTASIMQAVGQQLQAFAQEIGGVLQQLQGGAPRPAVVANPAARKYGAGGVYQEPIGRPGFDRRRRGKKAQEYAAEAVASDRTGVSLGEGAALARMVQAGNADTSLAAQLVQQAGSVEEIAANLRAGVMPQQQQPSQEEQLRAQVQQLQAMIAAQSAPPLASPAPVVHAPPVQVPVQQQWAPPQQQWAAPPPGWSNPRYPMQQFVAPQPWNIRR
jgi:hypothetical protein